MCAADPWGGGGCGPRSRTRRSSSTTFDLAGRQAIARLKPGRWPKTSCRGCGRGPVANQAASRRTDRPQPTESAGVIENSSRDGRARSPRLWLGSSSPVTGCRDMPRISVQVPKHGVQHRVQIDLLVRAAAGLGAPPSWLCTLLPRPANGVGSERINWGGAHGGWRSSPI